MRAKKRRRTTSRFLGRDPIHTLLVFAAILCGLVAVYFAVNAAIAARYLLPGIDNPDSDISVGFIMAGLILFGISLIHTVDRPPSLRRVTTGRRWLRAMRK